MFLFKYFLFSYPILCIKKQDLQQYSWILPEEEPARRWKSPSINTTKMSALKKTYKKEDKQWVIYTHSQISMHFIKYNEEINPILNQIYDI